MTTGTLPDFPDEVVTLAPVRYLQLPRKAGTAALISLDNGFDHKKPNTFGPRSLHALAAALDEVSARTDLVAVCLTGKPFIFSVGADLKVFRQLEQREQVIEIGQLGHRVFGRLGTLGVPTFAFVNGAAMGGGLEVALHCTYRTVSSAAAALALPEVFLGLIPGWGGSYLLPHLIGPDRAVTVMVENPLSFNRMLKPKQALELGVVDAMFEPADFIERSLDWTAQVILGDVAVSRPDTADESVWSQAVERGREISEAKTSGVPPAPKRALELITAARTTSRDDAFAAEDQALADLTLSPELAASLYAFDLVQKRARRPVGVPTKGAAKPITKVGIIGAGLMASQLALLFAQRLEVPVHLIDIDEERAARGVESVRDEITAMAKKGKLSPDAANRLHALVTGGADHQALIDADFVIEAVFEDLHIKCAVLADVEKVVSEQCVLATNTSSLSVTAMAQSLQHPQRLVGFHFFNPVSVMQLIEVVRTPDTDDATVVTAFALAKQLKKSAVLVQDSPAFVVNRLLTRFLGEILAVVDEGTPIKVADQALAPLGLPMSPFLLLQLVGPAVALHVAETMHSAFPERFAVSENLARLVGAGKAAVYVWDTGSPEVDPTVAALLVVGDQPATPDQVRERVLNALADEVARMLDEHVVSAVQDIDLCLVLGAGWPFWLGGITPYLDRVGASQRAAGRIFHPGEIDAL